MEIFTGLSLISLVWFVIGYGVGHLNGSKKDIREFVDETGKVIKIEAKKLYQPTISTGQIRPKTAEQIQSQQMNPQRREALEETKKTLDNIPELVAAKELLQSMKKEEYGKERI